MTFFRNHQRFFCQHLAVMAVLLVAVALPGCTPANRQVSPPSDRFDRLSQVDSWAFAIGVERDAGVLGRLSSYDLVVLDGEEATSQEVAQLQESGVLVVGYLSVGTIEPWRSWYERLQPFALHAWEDWDEYYADVSAADYRSIIADEVAPQLLDKGFDGVFLDNIDAVDTLSGLDEGMASLVSELAEAVHADGGIVLTQNGWDVHERLSLWEHVDGWNREDVTRTYDFDAETYVRVGPADHRGALDELVDVRRRGIITFATDYTEFEDAAADAAREAAVAVGAVPYVSDIELARLPPSE